MADKAISQLTEATEVQSGDLFVLEQTGVAKKLTGQTLMQDLATALAGHGGIANIAYAPPVSPSLAGTMTITLADGTNYTVTVNDGNGITGVVVNYGISTSGTNPALVQSWSASVTPPTDQYPYLWTRLVFSYKNGTSTTAYSVTVKAEDPAITVGTVTAQPGVSAGASVINSGTANDPILDFSFTLPQGDKGDTGDYIVPVVSFGTSTAAATEPVTWYSSPTSISYTAGNFIWQKTEYTLHDAQTVQNTEKKIIGYIGQNGSGSGTVQQITFNGTVYADDGTGNVPMTVDAEDVGAIADPSTKSNGQVLTYDSSADEWVAANPSTGNVNTVNSKGVDAGTTNITIYATDIKMSSGDNTTVSNAIPSASTATPVADGGAGSAGSSTAFAKGDHKHPYPAVVHVGNSAPSDTDVKFWLDTDEQAMSVLKVKDDNNSWVSIPAGGVGVPSGGTAGQYLKKSSSTDYATEWDSFPSIETLSITKNTSGWSENDTWAERKGDLVIVHVYVHGTTANYKNIATGLPAPSALIQVADIGGVGLLALDTTGALYIVSASTGAWYGGTIAYFVGS